MVGQCPITAHVSGGRANRAIIAANLENVRAYRGLDQAQGDWSRALSLLYFFALAMRLLLWKPEQRGKPVDRRPGLWRRPTQQIAHTTPATTVVQISLAMSRGTRGAPGSVPGAAVIVLRRTPNGSMAKSTTHQIIRKIAIAGERLRPARARPGCRRSPWDGGTAPACRGRRSSARRRRARGRPRLQAVAGGDDVVDLVADVVDAAGGVASRNSRSARPRRADAAARSWCWELDEHGGHAVAGCGTRAATVAPSVSR